MNEFDVEKADADERAAYQAYMAKQQHANVQQPYHGGAIGTLLGSAPDYHLKAQLLALAVQHNGVGSRNDSAVMEAADKFMDFVYGPKVEAHPAYNPQYLPQISDTLAASDAEAETVRAPGGARVSYAYMMGRIANTHFTYPPACPHMTVAEVTFDNGFTLIGSSAPADPRNFDTRLGQKYALENAMRQAWPLFGFLLCELQHKGADLTDFTLPSDEPSTTSPEPSQTAFDLEPGFGREREADEFPSTPHFG